MFGFEPGEDERVDRSPDPSTVLNAGRIGSDDFLQRPELPLCIREDVIAAARTGKRGDGGNVTPYQDRERNDRATATRCHRPSLGGDVRPHAPKGSLSPHPR